MCPCWGTRGCGPHFSLSCQRKVAAAAVEKKTLLCPKPALWAGLDQYGSCRDRCGADLQACTGCAWALGNRDGASPHLEVRSGFRNHIGSGSGNRRKSMRLPLRFTEAVSNAGVYSYHTAMYSAPGRRLPYLGSTVCNIPRFAQT